MRVSRFKLKGDFAGKDGATIVIAEVADNKFEFRVRPKHSREDVTADLTEIAKFILAGGGRMPVEEIPSIKAPPKPEYKDEAPPPNADKPVAHKRAKKKSATEIAKSIVAEKPWYEVEAETETKKKGKK
jgi:hypothetical protein